MWQSQNARCEELNLLQPQTLENISIENLQFLTPNDCQRIRATLFELKQYWQARTPIVPFYTLGAASYLDADPTRMEGRNEGYYVSRAAHFNPILREHFGWLYDRLTVFLASRLGAPVTFRQNGGLPGFNLMFAHRAFQKITASIHCDWQYRNLDWSWASIRDPRAISFTLGISLPQEGSGINIWDLSEERIFSFSDDEMSEYLKSNPPLLFYYAVGYLALHFGHVLHQVPAPQNVQKGDERITMQGHGLLCDGIWYIYW
jgi:hypothetical protein